MAPIQPGFEPELLRLARTNVTYADAWRALIPVARRLEQPRPTYDSVRRYMEAERERIRDVEGRRRRQQQEILNPLLAGRIPKPY